MKYVSPMNPVTVRAIRGRPVFRKGWAPGGMWINLGGTQLATSAEAISAGRALYVMLLPSAVIVAML